MSKFSNLGRGSLQTRARRLSGTQKKQLTYWLFLIPFLVGFLFLFLWIYGNSLWYSFNDISTPGPQGFTTTWVGMKNYHDTLTGGDGTYLTAIISSVGTMAKNVILATLYSLFIAVILSQKMKGRTVFRAIFFIPVILATGFMTKADMLNNSIMTGAWNDMGSTTVASGTTIANGLFSSLDIAKYLYNLGLPSFFQTFVIGAVTGIFDIINISGVQMLIFLAGLQSISPSIYESADIDGASSWETFWLITFPMISPIILVNVVYTVIDSFTREDNLVMQQVQRVRLQAGGMGLASAMAWFYFLIVLALLGIVAFIFSRFTFYQQRD